MLLNNGDRSNRRMMRQLQPASINNENFILNSNVNPAKDKSISFATNNENAYSSKKLSRKLKDSAGGEHSKSKNPLVSSRTGSTKKQNRRAFGDISNRNQNNGISAVEKSKSGIKQKGLSVKTPYSNNNKSISTGSKRSTRTTFVSTANKHSIIPKTQSRKNSGLKFVLPQRTVTLEQQKKNNIENYQISNSFKKTQRINMKPEPPVEDVEYPAGRLWHQEQSLLEDEEFQASFDLSEEVIGLNNMLDEERKAKIESLEKRYNESSCQFESNVKRFSEQRETEDFSSSIDDEFILDENIHSSCADDLANDFFLSDDISI